MNVGHVGGRHSGSPGYCFDATALLHIEVWGTGHVAHVMEEVWGTGHVAHVMEEVWGTGHVAHVMEEVWGTGHVAHVMEEVWGTGHVAHVMEEVWGTGHVAHVMRRYGAQLMLVVHESMDTGHGRWSTLHVLESHDLGGVL